MELEEHLSRMLSLLVASRRSIKKCSTTKNSKMMVNGVGVFESVEVEEEEDLRNTVEEVEVQAQVVVATQLIQEDWLDVDN